MNLIQKSQTLQDLQPMIATRLTKNYESSEFEAVQNNAHLVHGIIKKDFQDFFVLKILFRGLYSLIHKKKSFGFGVGLGLYRLYTQKKSFFEKSFFLLFAYTPLYAKKNPFFRFKKGWKIVTVIAVIPRKKILFFRLNFENFLISIESRFFSER